MLEMEAFTSYFANIPMLFLFGGSDGLDISPIITHRFDVKDFQKGFDAMISGQSGKVILDWAHIND